jgi:hypothetical protein
LLGIAAKVLPNRTVMVYQEVFDNNITLPDRVVFGVWMPPSDPGGGSPASNIPQEVTNIVKAGHQVVLANGNNGEWCVVDIGLVGWARGMGGQAAVLLVAAREHPQADRANTPQHTSRMATSFNRCCHW